MPRKNTLIKLLVGVPVVWVLALLLIGLSDHPDSSLTKGERERIKQLEAQNSELIARAAKKHEVERKLALEKAAQHESDDDHPIEEQEKAKQQQNDPHHPAPLVAPKQASNYEGAGELGKPVNIDKDKLSPEERKKFDIGWKDHAFNTYVSDMISIHRTLADVRDPECKKVNWTYPLPTASVIVIFHNEAWSVLLRTIHSVIDRSDPKLLKEVIVVDDFSDMRKFQF
jgi:hypothetical protein